MYSNKSYAFHRLWLLHQTSGTSHSLWLSSSPRSPLPCPGDVLVHCRSPRAFYSPIPIMIWLYILGRARILQCLWGGKKWLSLVDCLWGVHNRSISHHHSNFLDELQLWHEGVSVNTHTVEPLLSVPRLSGLKSQFCHEYLLVMIRIRSNILFKTIALKSAFKSEFVLLLRWLNTVFTCAFADAIQCAHKDCKKQTCRQ